MIARKYLYLLALARERHFGRAAESCHVSPSTLSAAIRDLEGELGVALVVRGQRFAGLTAEGECVVAHAKRVAAGADDLRHELGMLRDGLRGPLRIGVIPTALPVVASLTNAFADAHPAVAIEVRSASTQAILTQLRNFELEAGVVYSHSADAADLRYLPLWREQLVFVTSACGAVEDDRLEWTAAARQPLCLLSRDMQNRQTIDRVFESLECTPHVGLETNSILSLLAHVRTGRWSTILPRSVLGLVGAPEELRVLPLVKPSVAWETGLVTLKREPGSPLVDALLAAAGTISPVFGKSE
ncbi:LysR family transcriptional regulator [Aromatoleum toluclasticum]|uniref:LysR family transcriptional regulator n=1 Tax=Aromatoleum toluclasticum TaxID=92003 RepID=UPI001D17D4C0|nr:LysR substrate-binding domain-containing protein [Aromatoleum toluclasticum]MCC4113823.1 LysR family transcriptional regulator [Aromatoleum toluclasticum]